MAEGLEATIRVVGRGDHRRQGQWGALQHNVESIDRHVGSTIHPDAGRSERYASGIVEQIREPRWWRGWRPMQW